MSLPGMVEPFRLVGGQWRSEDTRRAMAALAFWRWDQNRALKGRRRQESMSPLGGDTDQDPGLQGEGRLVAFGVIVVYY